ncbi:hypothetical protein VEL58_004086 [Cronobacter sakazakii]|nr:hypothetical protein [Cronobacter sakazakii]
MSTISNDVLEKLSVRYRLLAKIHDGSESQAWEESALIVDELLALRKEREKAEPDFYVVVTSVGVWQSFHRSRAEAEFIVNKPFNPGYSVLEIYTVPPAPTDKPKSEMSQKAEQLLRDTTALAGKLSAETDTTAQQFESLAGKAVVPDGWRLVPIDPTKDMLRAGQSVVGFWLNTIKCYEAMLAAAPEPCK